jgi:hypothetical protein
LLEILYGNLACISHLKSRLLIDVTSPEIENDIHDEVGINKVTKVLDGALLELLVEGYFKWNLDAVVDH